MTIIIGAQVGIRLHAQLGGEVLNAERHIPARFLHAAAEGVSRHQEHGIHRDTTYAVDEVLGGGEVVAESHHRVR